MDRGKRARKQQAWHLGELAVAPPLLHASHQAVELRGVTFAVDVGNDFKQLLPHTVSRVEAEDALPRVADRIVERLPDEVEDVVRSLALHRIAHDGQRFDIARQPIAELRVARLQEAVKESLGLGVKPRHLDMPPARDSGYQIEELFQRGR
jgi:hypothetical protein